MLSTLRLLIPAFLLGALVLLLRWFWRQFRRRAEASLPTGREGMVRKVTYHDNGRMKSERYLLDGVMHGPWMLWDEDGNKIVEGEHKQGMLHGLEVRYGDDGQKLSETQWVEGRRHGTASAYDPDGGLVRHLCYIHAEDEAEPAHEGACAEDELKTPKPE